MLESIAEFSCLRLLRFCSIQQLGQVVLSKFLTVKTSGNPKVAPLVALLGTLPSLCYGVLGLLAVMVKIAQLDFVPTTLYLNFTLEEIIRLISFATNVASVYDIGDEKKAAVRRFLVQNYEHALCDCDEPAPIIMAWERKLASELRTRFGACKACQRFKINSDRYLRSTHVRSTFVRYGWKARA